MKRLALFLGLPILFAGAAVVLYLKLLPDLPMISGTNLVGYYRIAIGDDQRWVDAQIFYPAAEETENQPEAMPADLAAAFGKAYGAPEFAMRDDRLLPVYEDAQAAGDKLPVIIFNHGHGMFATQNTHQVIDLASNGYVVIALNHPGHSLLAKRGDQTITRAANIAAYTPEETARLLQRQADGNEELRATTNLNNWVFAMDALQQDAFADIVDQFPEWVENNQLVLDALKDIDNGNIKTPLMGKLDIEKIGYLGHSFGGAVATHMGMNDRRVKAAYNMDGPVFTWSLNPHPRAQFCFAYNDSNNQAGVKSSAAWINQQVAKAVAGCERTFLGAAHMNFSDLNEIFFLSWLGQLGPINHIQMRDSLNASLVQFFDQHLLGKGESTELEGTEFVQH